MFLATLHANAVLNIIFEIQKRKKMNIKKAFNIFDLVVFRSSIQCFFSQNDVFFPNIVIQRKGVTVMS